MTTRNPLLDDLLAIIADYFAGELADDTTPEDVLHVLAELITENG